jgi:alpha-1,2-mannosyltransferase
VYPALCLAASSSVVLVMEAFVAVTRQLMGHEASARAKSSSSPRLPGLVKVGIAALVALFEVASASRSLALYFNYRAPLSLYAQLSHYAAAVEVSQHAQAASQAKVCVGKEWYRFPSHFFLPDTASPLRLEFIASSFDGSL